MYNYCLLGKILSLVFYLYLVLTSVTGQGLRTIILIILGALPLSTTYKELICYFFIQPTHQELRTFKITCIKLCRPMKRGWQIVYYLISS